MKFKFKINSKEYFIRMLVVILAAVSPLVLLITHGYLPSLSSYWRTEWQPLFIITNAVTSYYLYSIKNWKISALTLLLLTAFSVELFPITHNILAGVFFIVNIYPFWATKHYRYLLWFYLSSLVALTFSMFIAEIIAIETMCIYHGLMLRRIYKFSTENSLGSGK